MGEEKKGRREKEAKWSAYRHTHAHKQSQALGVSLQVLLGAGRAVSSRTFSAVDPQESQFSECPVLSLTLAPRADLQSSTPFSQSLKMSLCFPMHTQVWPLVCQKGLPPYPPIFSYIPIFTLVSLTTPFFTSHSALSHLGFLGLHSTMSPYLWVF